MLGLPQPKGIGYNHTVRNKCNKYSYKHTVFANLIYWINEYRRKTLYLLTWYTELMNIVASVCCLYCCAFPHKNDIGYRACNSVTCNPFIVCMMMDRWVTSERWWCNPRFRHSDRIFTKEILWGKHIRTRGWIVFSELVRTRFIMHKYVYNLQYLL